MSRVLFGVLFAAIAMGALVGVAQAGGRGCRNASADDPMTTREHYGIASCHVRGPRYHINSFLGEGARGYAPRASSDSMVWSDAQWRSSLFDGYVRGYNDAFDRRFRRAGHVEWPVIVTSQLIVVRQAADMVVSAPSAKRPRAKVLNMRTGQVIRPIANSARFSGHRCSGVLILTWKAGVPRSRCHDSRTRIRRL